ncbi:centrosomal protein of 89 kDa isoform X1 [Manduca sexta]|nr:centrosomal protein of 89 kDa isoform X1 [Manduca sexta]
MPQSEFWPFTRNKVSDVGFNEEASNMQKQLGDMEGQVKEIQMELAAIKRDRMDLLAQNQIKMSVKESEGVNETSLFNETYNKLQGNSCEKYMEVNKLREELIKAKNNADQERLKREKYEKKLKDLELKLNNICYTGMLAEAKDSRKINDEEVSILKKQMRDLKDELEESKLIVAEKSEQLQEYRVKYLQAQQEVEELKRQFDVVESDNKQVSDQLQIEIQRMKMQFQEKLQELAPLPDLLKGAQIQLEEAKQLQRLAEDTSRQLSNELHFVKEKLAAVVNNLNQEKLDRANLMEENKALKADIEQKDKEIEKQCLNIDDYKCQVLRLEEKLNQEEVRYNEKTAECSRLVENLEELREETSRTLNRSKERSDSTRRYLQTQISELERQVIQSRAQCRAVHKERDEIRQRMQMQINSLQENFELVEIRLRALHTQVTSLMNTSVLVLADNDDNEFN